MAIAVTIILKAVSKRKATVGKWEVKEKRKKAKSHLKVE
jgi:hypothetical protein